jgi:hypothetical protein
MRQFILPAASSGRGTTKAVLHGGRPSSNEGAAGYAGNRGVEPACIECRDQTNHHGTRAEDAEAGDAIARNARGHGTHPIDRRRAGTDWQGGSAAAHGLGAFALFSVGLRVILYRGKSRPYNAPLSWGYSSAGRALAWHARGQRFDPAYLHQRETGGWRLETRKDYSEILAADFRVDYLVSSFLPSVSSPYRLEA